MPDGRTYWRNRWQTWDATFGLSSHTVTLSQKRGAKIVKASYVANAIPSFFDSSPTAYWDARIPTNSVKTAGSGLRIDILGVSEDKTTYRVHISKAQ